MIRYIFVFLLTMNLTNAREFYINGVIGSDTTASFDGSKPTLAFKSINKALDLVKHGDVIIIEGLAKESRITYKENIIIQKDKPFLILKGINYPIIESNNDNENSGVIIQNSDIRIEGIEFKGILNGRINSFNQKGGAGIIINKGNRDADIQNCRFENCNFGIIAHENQSIRINGNTFSNLKKYDRNEIDGGIGILILSDGKYIQDNQIGTKFGNSFSDIDNYGILIGSIDNSKLVLGDYSKINNNSFKNMKGIGIGIFNLEGIMNVSKNTFEKCNTSLEIRGESIDAVISDNTFLGAIGDYEILTNEEYPGELLYSIWKGNNNKFEMKLRAISDGSEDSIKAINGKRFITSKENIINDNSKNQVKILE